MIKPIGKQVPKEALWETFPANEGGIQAIIGMIGSGKSTEAVRRIKTSLSNGKAVYTNILLDLSGVEFDDRNEPWYVFTGLFTFRKRYYVFDKKNYHYFSPKNGTVDGKKTFAPISKDPDGIIKWLNSITDAEIYYDEGQRVVNSYEGTRVSKDKLDLIEETRHMNRLLVIITQRANRIHVNARANVNQFFLCHKQWSWFPFLVFPILKYYVTEYQAMVGNEVDVNQPVTRKVYTVRGNHKVWSMFNTHELRDGKPKSQKIHFTAYDFGMFDKVKTIAYWTGKKSSDSFIYSRQYIKTVYEYLFKR